MKTGGSMADSFWLNRTRNSRVDVLGANSSDSNQRTIPRCEDNESPTRRCCFSDSPLSGNHDFRSEVIDFLYFSTDSFPADVYDLSPSFLASTEYFLDLTNFIRSSV
jgi:hypothetical protein